MSPAAQSPRFHLAPARTWANDPNGPIWIDGTWHVFFQNNPQGTFWGNISWGHATSSDLVNWVEQAPALRADSRQQIFSGCTVLDDANTSGLGSDERPPLVAIFTADLPGTQVQSLASSVDGGFGWTLYPGNPVLDRGSANFRDPKVFRYQDAWILVAVEAEQQQVVLYRSGDLITWSYLSSFGPAHAVDGAWECPDLFPLPVAGADEVRWVLIVSINPGGVAGGSGCQYFVGEFDGTSFVPERVAVDTADFDWFDHGKDCYAVTSFAEVPDARRLVIGWMNNWDYAREVPLTGGRGQLTCPRELGLIRDGDRHRLTQRPARELDAALRRVRLSHGQSLPVGEVELGYRDGQLHLTRPGADFHPGFGATMVAAVPGAADDLELDVLVDECSIEVFSADGLLAVTALVH